MDEQKLNVVEYQKHIEASLKNLAVYIKSQKDIEKKKSENEKFKKWMEGLMRIL